MNIHVWQKGGKKFENVSTENENNENSNVWQTKKENKNNSNHLCKIIQKHFFQSVLR